MLFKGKYKTDSCRLSGWNYAEGGWYYVTVCAEGKKAMFGKVENEKMHLFAAGVLAEKYWKEIPERFENARLSEFVIMPNHMHGIIVLSGDEVGAGAEVKRVNVETAFMPSQTRRDAINRVSTISAALKRHNPMQSSHSLSKIVRWFKGRTTYEVNKVGIKGFAWQDGFHDHIIRSERAFEGIAKYIGNNVLKWHLDEYNPKCVTKKRAKK